MQETSVIFEDDKQLRAFLNLGLHIPKLLVWVKVSAETYETKCKPELGDGRKTVKTQYVGQLINDEQYIVLGRDSISRVTGEPTGLPMAVDKEIQQAWVAEVGIENIFLNLPEQIEK